MNTIQWQAEGIGFLAPLYPFEYGKEYWQEYRRRDIGWRLVNARTNLVEQYYGGPINIDIGIGGGAFLESSIQRKMNFFGHDVNEQAVEWLKSINRCWCQSQPARIMTFWDSFEHILDPSKLLESCREYCFISTPIYDSELAASSSKHFKPGEHLWYFTQVGLVNLMKTHSFQLVESSNIEEQIGREGVGTFVFKRESS